MTTKKELQERWKSALKEITDQAHLAKVMGELLAYSAEHYDELDVEAKEMVDAQFDSLKQLNDLAIEQVKLQPDSISKREILRTHRKTKGIHFDVKDLLTYVAERPKEESEMIKEAERVFEYVAQLAYNYLSDIVDTTLKGGLEGAKLAMFYSALDEACVAMHLAVRSYAPQSMSHIRHIIETTNLLILFQKDPSYVDYWTSDDYRERRKIRPEAVRKILGKSLVDNEVYWLLSDLGNHPSFKYIQTKAKVRKNAENLQFKINVGGIPDPFHTQQALTACLAAAMSLLSELINIYGHLLLTEEVERDTAKARQEVQDFLTAYVKPPQSGSREFS